jgi:hypothetical protein
MEGLAALFELGPVLQDRNGDAQADFVAARLILPNTAAPEDVAAALAVAGRLGLETSGLSFPLAFRASEVSQLRSGPTAFVIGRGNELLPEGVRRRIEKLEAGQGLVAYEDGVVVIAGVDDLGTRAAGEAFASRSPYLWNVIGRDQGDTYEKLTTDAVNLLGSGGVQVTAVTFDELVYQHEVTGAVRVTATASVSPGACARAHELLATLAEQHRRGVGTDRLNYASAAEVVLRVSDGRESRGVAFARLGVPNSVLNPPRRRATRFPRAGGNRGRGARGGGGRGGGARGGSRAGRRFDLAELFTAQGGLLQDEDGDRIPDDSDMMIVLPRETYPAGEFPALGITQLAARIGLESTGLSFPLSGFDRELEDPEAERRPLVLVGRHNRLVRDLRRLGKLREPGAPAGIGRVEMVPDAFGGNSAVVVTGGDRDGEEAAAEYLSHRVPHLWEIGRGEQTLVDVKDGVRKLLGGRTTASQAAQAFEALEKIIEDLEDKELNSVSVELFFEAAAPEFDRWLAGELGRRLGPVEIEVKSRARMDPVEVFVQRPELEWEVDAFWKRFRDEVLPKVNDGSKVDLELRVTEAPELRAELAGQIRAEIEARGGRPGEITVLSAYKQGLSWLMDKVVPALVNKDVQSLEIGWQPFPVELDSEHRFQSEPARWLNELYPADDVLAVEMGLPLTAFTFFARQEDVQGESIYTLEAKNSSGEIVHEDSFSPVFYERPYLDAFPDYAQVTVTTGWLKARIDDAVILDERVHTDSDRIWEHFQSETLKAVYDHVKSTTGGKPTRDKAPFFHTLRVELRASEPDFKLGIDQEHVSSLESLHDDFYFDSLDFFNEVARTAAGGDAARSRSLAAGNILPWIHPERRGQAPELTITYSGFAAKEPKLVVKYRVKGEEKDSTESRTLSPVTVPEPYIYLAETDSSQDGLNRLGLLVELSDTQGLPRLAITLDNLTRLQEQGLFPGAFGFRGVRQVTLRLEAPGATSTRTYDSHAPERPAMVPEPYTGETLVTWDHVISPAESERISHTLGTLPNVTTYVAGRSYQGRPVSVMEIRLPMEAELVSQAKLNAWKPVLSIIGRQHANEVSSTSHILRLAELLATDPQYQRYLKEMNIVIHPVSNPDGAALAYELQKLTPTHCLHAGRYTALGPDVTGQSGNANTLVTEALVLREIADRWVPDVRLNPHGYPSHEWVHQFANYNPKSFRSYWIPRGWYTSARVTEDPRLGDYRDATLAMLDYIADEVSADPEVVETNRRIYDRYQRWAIRWQPHLYNLEIYRDTAIYHSRRGGGVSFAGAGSMIRTTVFSGGTEAMDETAQGPWLDLVTRMGFGYLMASVRFLDEADYSLYRMEGQSGVGTRIATTRPRPIRPGKGASNGSGRQR